MTHRIVGVFSSAILFQTILCGPGSVAEEYHPPANADELAAWVTGAFPEWDGDMVSSFVDELSRALEETSEPLTPAEQSELIAHMPALIMHTPLGRDQELVPSDVPAFIEMYRYRLQNYVVREPVTPEERALVATQLSELIRYGLDSWERLGMPGDPRSEAMLEREIEALWWRLESPFSSQFKRPLSDAEMKALYDSIDEESRDYLWFKENRVGPDDRPEEAALDFASFMFKGLAIHGHDELPPIPEKMRALSKQAGDERSRRVKERAAQDHAAYVKRFQEEQERDRAMMAQLKREAREAMQKAAPSQAAPVDAPPAQPVSAAPKPAVEAAATPEQEDEPPRWYWIPGVALAFLAAAALWRFRPSRPAGK